MTHADVPYNALYSQCSAMPLEVFQVRLLISIKKTQERVDTSGPGVLRITFTILFPLLPSLAQKKKRNKKKRKTSHRCHTVVITLNKANVNGIEWICLESLQ